MACWEGYVAKGTKMKNGREVPNCVPVGKGVKNGSSKKSSSKTKAKVKSK